MNQSPQSLAVFRVGAPPAVPAEPDGESTVTRSWVGDRPVVSILCPTYRHAEFVEDALNGFLSQQTDFPFEILIRDDASDDGTAEIVRDYAERYPNIIRAKLEKTNQWPMVQPFDVLRKEAAGEFIALCEGDDYWTDPKKLSQQVAQLRRSPSAVVSHHQSVVVESGVVVNLHRLAPKECVNHGREALRRGGRLLTNTLLFRNVALPANPYTGRYPSGIKFLRVAFGFVGEAVFLEDVGPSVYRRHAGGVSAGADAMQSDLNVVSTHLLLADFLGREGDPDAARVHATRVMDVMEGMFARSGVRPRVLRWHPAWTTRLRTTLRPLKRVPSSVRRGIRARS